MRLYINIQFIFVYVFRYVNSACEDNIKLFIQTVLHPDSYHTYTIMLNKYLYR